MRIFLLARLFIITIALQLALGNVVPAYAIILYDGSAPNADTDVTNADTFILDDDDSATTGSLTIQFGQALAEALSFDIDNDYFFLSDALVVDGNVNVQGDTIRLDSDNAGAGANVSLLAEQGSDNDGTLRYNATTNQWEVSDDAGTFFPVAGTLDDAYNTFEASASTVSVDAAEGQTGGVTFAGSLTADETLTVTNTGNGGTVLLENTGTGDSLRVNDAANDTSPFVIDDAGLIGAGLAVPTFNFHLFDNASSLATEWIGLDDGTNQVSILSGTQDPKVTATDADIGSLFLSSSNGQFYIKQDDGSTVNWNLSGLSNDLNDALIGTFGTPGLTNKFVTDTDPRLSATSGNFGEVTIGTRLDYPATNQTISNNFIYFIRVFLPADTAVASFGIFTTQAKTGNFNFAIYDDNSDAPGDLLAEVGSTAATTPVNDFLTASLGTPEDITVAGFYWVAFASTEQPKAQMYLGAEDQFIPFRVQTKGTGSVAMPATATPNAKGGNYNLPYIAAFE